MLANWISETTATTGTGPISLGGASSADLLAFNTQYLTGSLVRYDVKDGNNRETGIGTLTSGTPWTLARTTIKETLVAGVFTKNPSVGITLSGSAVVSIDATAQDINSKILRFVSPQSKIPIAPAASTGTTLVQRIRWPFYIGSGDVESLILSFNGWYFNYAGQNALGNSYNVLKAAIEIEGDTYSVPLTFGGVRNKVINSGDTDIQTDPINARAFSRASIPRNTKCWIRADCSVNVSGQSLPGTGWSWNEPPWSTGGSLWIDPAVFNGFVVDSYGVASAGSAGGYDLGNYPNVPIVLGTFVNGDPTTLIALGDSITYGLNDTLTGFSLIGGFSRATGDDAHTGSILAGANFGVSSALASHWVGATGPQAYLKYAKYGLEQYGTNEFTGGGSSAVAQTNSSNLWAIMFAAGIEKIIRNHVPPRTLADGVTPANIDYQAGGAARQFNSWLDTLSVPNLIVYDNNSFRAGASGDLYYQWLGGSANTFDGTHPNAAGYILESNDYRAVFENILGLSKYSADSRYIRKVAAGVAGVAITLGASPYAYTAQAAGIVAVSGGTVSAITLTRNSVVVWSASTFSDLVPVCLGDIVTVTYTVAPTMYMLAD
jgi:lysophospholipase L1-like esterase